MPGAFQTLKNDVAREIRDEYGSRELPPLWCVCWYGLVETEDGVKAWRQHRSKQCVFADAVSRVALGRYRHPEVVFWLEPWRG